MEAHMEPWYWQLIARQSNYMLSHGLTHMPSSKKLTGYFCVFFIQVGELEMRQFLLQDLNETIEFIS